MAKTTVGHRGLQKLRENWALDVQTDGVRKNGVNTAEKTHPPLPPESSSHVDADPTSGSDFTFTLKKRDIRPKSLQTDASRARYKGLVEIIPDFQVQTASRPQDPCLPSRGIPHKILPKASVDCRKNTRASVCQKRSS